MAMAAPLGWILYTPILAARQRQGRDFVSDPDCHRRTQHVHEQDSLRNRPRNRRGRVPWNQP
jgi:hypothetical protein